MLGSPALACNRNLRLISTPSAQRLQVLKKGIAGMMVVSAETRPAGQVGARLRFARVDNPDLRGGFEPDCVILRLGMREEVVRFAVSRAGPRPGPRFWPGHDGQGGLGRRHARPRRRLEEDARAAGRIKVQAAFEALPFRDGAFASVVAGFSLRDSRDLLAAVGEVRRVTRAAGGSRSATWASRTRSKAVMLGVYIRVGSR